MITYIPCTGEHCRVSGELQDIGNSPGHWKKIIKKFKFQSELQINCEIFFKFSTATHNNKQIIQPPPYTLLTN